MTKEFYSLDEIEEYYDEKSNTYIFKEDGKYIDLVVFNFDLNIQANIDAKNIDAYNIDALNIDACNIDASDIKAMNIEAWDINAWNIEAQDISYYAVCFAYNNIKCKSIKGRRNNTKHFVLDGKLEVENDR